MGLVPAGTVAWAAPAPLIVSGETTTDRPGDSQAIWPLAKAGPVATPAKSDAALRSTVAPAWLASVTPPLPSLHPT